MTAEEKLLTLFTKWSGHVAQTILPLPESGSARQYYRIRHNDLSVVGVHHHDDAENRAFVHFAKHFREQGLSVPEVLVDDLREKVYLQQDLGDQTLFSILQHETESSCNCKQYLESAVSLLPEFQVKAHEGLDYGIAYPREAFDSQSMRWDLNYFKYHFLKFTGVVFNEQALENDFDTLIGVLKSAPRNFFMYRDFQTRNIMVHDERVWFIDFQGGRKGHPAYDLASLLFDAKADLSVDLRESLLVSYLSKASQYGHFDIKEFTRLYPGFVLIRKLQALGAFGFRGIFEGKTHFLQSIPFALDNFKWIIENYSFPFHFPELKRILSLLPESSFRLKIEQQIKTIVV